MATTIESSNISAPKWTKSQSRKILSTISLIGILFPALKFLIGNKSDLENLIPSESVDNFSAAFECEYTYLFSAKTGRYFWVGHVYNYLFEPNVNFFYSNSIYNVTRKWVCLFRTKRVHIVKTFYIIEMLGFHQPSMI